MPSSFSRRVSRRRRQVFTNGAEQLETRRLLTAEISGSVFHDTDGDGAHDAAEVGITGAMITLTGTTDNGDSVSRRFLTDSEGSFKFADLEDGTYEVAETQPAGVSDGQDSTDASGVTTANNRFSDITVEDGDAITGLHFGEGLIDAQYISPLWILASSGRESVRRNMRAEIEADIGSPQVADLIRDGVTEVDEDLELNEAPVANADSYTAAPGETLSVNASNGVLTNDTDLEDANLTAALVDQASNGTVNLSADGSFTYTPESGFVGSDSFTYVANDGFLDSSEATVSIEVTDPNAFTVSAGGAVEGDSLGTIAALAGTSGDPILFEVVEPGLDSRLELNADDHIVGLNEAPIVLIEYVDFACPGCQSFHPTVSSLKENRTRVAVVHRYLPNLTNFNAVEAAVAVEAASQQGENNFSIMMDKLFDDANFTTWREAADPTSLFEQYAGEIAGLDLDQFRADIADSATLDRVNRDKADADALGYSVTPTFVIDGEVQDYNQDPLLTPGEELDAAMITASNEVEQNQRFVVDRRSGELTVLAAGALDANDGPVTFDVRISTLDTSEIVSVTVDITN